MQDQQRQKAETFLRLHQGPDILVLPNAWDVVSARVFEQASFQAVGTTSSGIAASLGYLDGEQMPVAEMVAAIEGIARGIDLPVNADIESHPFFANLLPEERMAGRRNGLERTSYDDLKQ